MHAEVSAKLGARSMLSLYEVRIDETATVGHRHPVARIVPDEAVWTRGRSTDGFVLRVGHYTPDRSTGITCGCDPW